MFLCEADVRWLGVVAFVANSTLQIKVSYPPFHLHFCHYCVSQTKPICKMLKFKDKHNCLCVIGNYLTPLFRWRPTFRGGFSFRVHQTIEITGRKCTTGTYNTWSLTKFYNIVQKCHLETRKESSSQLGGKSNEKSHIYFIIPTSFSKIFTCCHL